MTDWTETHIEGTQRQRFVRRVGVVEVVLTQDMFGCWSSTIYIDRVTFHSTLELLARTAAAAKREARAIVAKDKGQWLRAYVGGGNASPHVQRNRLAVIGDLRKWLDAGSVTR